MSQKEEEGSLQILSHRIVHRVELCVPNYVTSRRYPGQNNHSVLLGTVSPQACLAARAVHVRTV